MEQCYRDVVYLRNQAVIVLTDIDRLVDETTRKKDRAIQKYPADAKPSKRKWYRHKSTLLPNGITLNSIVTSLNIERVELISGEGPVIHNAPSTPASQLDNWLHQAIELEDTSIKDTNSRFQFHLPRIIPSTAPVWSIIELGKLPELQDMLKEKSVSLHDVTASGRSLLNYAAVKGQVSIYEFLVNLGADPYFRDCSGINQPGVDRALTGTGLDRIVSKTAKAASYNLFINSETLDQQDFDFLHLVVLGLRDLALDLVLKQYLSPRSEIDVQDVNGRTPLIWTAWRGDIANVNLLLSSHADPDRVDNEGYTAIARAAKAGHLDCIRALLKAGASVQAANGDDYQPLHHASGNKANGLPIVDELLAHGADVRAVCFRGTPLHLAANRGSSATIKRLLHAGADIDAQDSDGDTPAMIALLCWNEPAFVTLMHAGAKLNIVRKSGQNILHLVTWAGSSLLWNDISERAQTDQLAGVDAGALHKGHGLQHCFENCRKLWFVGKRETTDIEGERFNRMLDAFVR
ncbi:hypothetical protein SLS60_004424 [Paraconiothyrium brasiliense]|uniref:Ankyrin repeat protein n=1 Tax=Paraconiothyrium brasiliense TaxID=300254 RepID=A0ABR3RKB4_9PLEO